MCDNVLLNYASAVNSVTDASTDLIPGLLLFSEPNCGGIQFPNNGGIGFITTPFVQGTPLSTMPFTVRSFFIPFNFNQVKMSDQDGIVNRSTFIGPILVTDTAAINWQTTLTSMLAAPIGLIQFVSIFNWPSQALVPMCMGKNQFIGPFSLNRYLPTTDRCDTFMSTSWCPTHLDNTECACFKELPGIEQKSIDLKVNLPVICFGENCATLNTYKTNSMLSKPCNLTICQQTINATPGIVNAGTDTVFCGGQFYKDSGSQILPSVSPLPSPGGATTSSATPFYVWIMLGISGLLFIVLVYLLFAPQKARQSSVLRQIQKLSKRSKSAEVELTPISTDNNTFNDTDVTTDIDTDILNQLPDDDISTTFDDIQQ